VPVHLVTERASAALSETVTPQGLVAVCALRDVPAQTLISDPPRLAVALAELADPGNAGTVLRTADACGAGTVVFGTGSADPYNGKVVRSSAGSLFHVDVVRSAPLADLVPQVQAAGMTVLAADGGGEVRLDEAADEGLLAAPVLWLFGNEARGLDVGLAAAASPSRWPPRSVSTPPSSPKADEGPRCLRPRPEARPELARGEEDGVLSQISRARFQSRSDGPPIRPTPRR
jgi:TrmH family RNA methyltransferase